MFKRVTLIGAVLAASIGSASANADGFFIGLKTGDVKFDVEELQNGRASGFQLGYEWRFGLAVQLEALSYSEDLEEDYFYGFSGDAELDTTAIYAAYRTPGTVYFLAKAGILHEKFELETSSFYWTAESESETDTGLSVGIGGGVRLGDHVLIEAEYTVIEQDADFLGLSASVQF